MDTVSSEEEDLEHDPSVEKITAAKEIESNDGDSDHAQYQETNLEFSVSLGDHAEMRSHEVVVADMLAAHRVDL